MGRRTGGSPGVRIVGLCDRCGSGDLFNGVCGLCGDAGRAEGAEDGGQHGACLLDVRAIASVTSSAARLRGREDLFAATVEFECLSCSHDGPGGAGRGSGCFFDDDAWCSGSSSPRSLP